MIKPFLQESKIKTFFSKIWRFLGLTQPIKLSETEQQWMFLAKGWYSVRVKEFENLKLLEQALLFFKKNYNVEHDREEALGVIFRILLALYQKIENNPIEIEKLTDTLISKDWHWQSDSAVERGVNKLLSILCNAAYLKHGVPIYKMDEDVLE